MSKKITSLVLILCLSVSSAAFSHSGRTDGSGGHKDNKNKSGLGSYHYHHGFEAHLHENGVCPYEVKSTPKKSNSAEIKAVQAVLNDLGYDCGKADGKLGSKTVAALKKYQKDNDLKVDGKIGAKTLEKLGL